jgi:hypothetical protein
LAQPKTLLELRRRDDFLAEDFLVEDFLVEG